MRTFVQIDVQNLFFAAKDIHKRIDFVKIKDEIKNTEDEVVGLNAYIIRTPDAKSDKFESLLKSLEYTIITKMAHISHSTAGQRIYKGTDHDIAICIDCVSNEDTFDKWILMSGDGDFIDLCKYMKKKGKIVEIWAFPGTSFNRMFCDYADTIKFINEGFFYSPKTNE